MQILSEKDIFSKDHTNVLKGIGIIVVFFNHIIPYLNSCGYKFSPLSESIIFGNTILTQLMVGVFLFVSGYGVFESIKAKGNNYVKSIPQRRVCTTLLNFDIAVILFLILDFILGIRLDVNKIVLSFIAWDSIGNSNWYIFAILCFYIFSYVSCRLCDDYKKANACLIVFAFIYCIVISYFKEEWFYNTVLCYASGSTYSCYKKQINRLIGNHFTKCLLTVTVIFLLSLALLRISILQNVFAISFANLVLILSSKYNLSIKWLKWAGQKLFPLYIYQRLPMLFIASISPLFVKLHPLLFFIISVIVTILMAIIIPQFRFNSCKIKLER